MNFAYSDFNITICMSTNLNELTHLDLRPPDVDEDAIKIYVIHSILYRLLQSNINLTS